MFQFHFVTIMHQCREITISFYRAKLDKQMQEKKFTFKSIKDWSVFD